MAEITVADKKFAVKDKASALAVIALMTLPKDRVKSLTVMAGMAETGGMTFDAWTTVAQSFQIMPKRSAIEGGWKSVLIERHPETKVQIDTVEGLVERLDQIAGQTKVEGEKDGKKCPGRLTYRVVVNFVADSVKATETATAAKTATVGKGGKK